MRLHRVLRYRLRFSPARAAPISTTAIAVSTAAATTTTTAAAAAEATRALRALLGLVHAEGTTVEHGAVHRGNGLLGLGFVAHGHEREAARLTGLAIGDDVDVGHGAVLLEGLTDGFAGGVKGEISNVETR